MIKRLSLYTLLLCLVPFFAWIFAWRWSGDANLTAFDQWLYRLTETGSIPYALATSVFLTLILMGLVGDKKYYKLIFITALLANSATQLVKSGLKHLVAEPRPYVMQIERQSQLSEKQFYAVSRTERGEIVSSFYADKAETPRWLKAHREHETGYSFPSGHSTFAAVWLLLFVGFGYLFRGRTGVSMSVAVTVILIWAVLMLLSRLRLGMHYPIDLFAAVIITWLTSVGIFFRVKEKVDAA